MAEQTADGPPAPSYPSPRGLQSRNHRFQLLQGLQARTPEGLDAEGWRTRGSVPAAHAKSQSSSCPQHNTSAFQQKRIKYARRHESMSGETKPNSRTRLDMAEALNYKAGNLKQVWLICQQL